MGRINGYSDYPKSCRAGIITAIQRFYVNFTGQ